jgi:hypothetical protein
MKLDGTSLGPYAGNGREDIVDGPLLPRRAYQLGYASFAQPSGLATDGKWLYVADSEGSSIRAVPFDPRKEVRTVVGTSHLMDGRLFTFGDTDGPPKQAKFQHPLGIAFHGGQLYIADTYNNKPKVIDPTTGAATTLVGTGKSGRDDEPASFDEPAGVSAADGKLYVADTNNHLVRVVDLATKRVSTLPIAGLSPPQPPAEKARSLVGAVEEKVELATAKAENGVIRLAIEIDLPPGYKINPLAPMAYRLEETLGEAGMADHLVDRKLFGKSVAIEKPSAHLEIKLPLTAAKGRDSFRFVLDYYYCRTGAEGLCKAGTVFWTIPLDVSPTAETAAIPLRHRVP